MYFSCHVANRSRVNSTQQWYNTGRSKNLDQSVSALHRNKHIARKRHLLKTTAELNKIDIVTESGTFKKTTSIHIYSSPPPNTRRCFPGHRTCSSSSHSKVSPASQPRHRRGSVETPTWRASGYTLNAHRELAASRSLTISSCHEIARLPWPNQVPIALPEFSTIEGNFSKFFMYN